MNTTHQRWFAWAIVPFVLVYLFGFIVLAGFVPPHAPSLPAGELVRLYDENRLGIRAGQLIGLVSSCLILLWAAPISAQMARIEKGPLPMLSLVQYGAALVLVVFFIVCSMLWTVAAYREDLSPELLRTINDAGWLTFVMVYPEYVVQLSCIAIVGLSDRRPRPFLPRWACFFTLWVALMGIGGGFSTFFKSGPFAWNGLIGFWLPVSFFLCWLGVMWHFLLAAIDRQAAEEKAHA
ncbi:hypothetical protein [Piscinibacter sp.]|uniref:hypothetical protein n=1 Tax=Piscinibacter sp. TaxID=1903157 RepID=UPI0039E3F9F3